MNKSMYIDLIEMVMAAYTDEHIRAYTHYDGNGHYTGAAAVGDRSVSLKIEISEI